MDFTVQNMQMLTICKIIHLLKKIIKKMLESVNLFPESRYFRIQRGHELNHKCGGASSLLIIAAILALLTVKLVQLFKFQTFFFTTDTDVDLQPRMTTISTEQDNQIHSPYMITTDFKSGGCVSTKSVKAYHYTVQNLKKGPPVVTASQIILQQCTASHFQVIPSLSETIKQVGIGQVLCLPINKTYQIGGSFQFSDTWKAILFQYNCTQSCGVNNCGTITVNQLNSLINPNSQKPFEYFLDRNDMDLSDRTRHEYVVELDENMVFTDKSIFPFAQIDTISGLSNQPFKKRKQIYYNSHTTTDLWIERSSITKDVERRYLKILDVFSYVGGIFPVFLASFFFLKSFGLYFFEMAFARRQFKCKQTKKYGFVHFLKNIIFQTMKSLGYPIKNWMIAKKQMEVKEVVNKVLDVNYFYRRIEVLEKAISLLLSKHQLKGIYLSHSTIKDADQQHKQFQIRDHIVKYLDKKGKEDYLKAKQKRQKQSIEKKQRKKASNRNQIVIKTEAPHQNGKKSPKSQKTESNRQFSNKDIIQMTGEDCIIESRGLDEQELQKLDRKKHIFDESKMIETLEEADEEWVSNEFEGDLSKLFMEARKSKGDPISKKIVQNMDGWLRSELEQAIADYKQENPRFQLRLISESDDS